jgi:polyhydroxybutyrate depolymerase
MAGTMAGAELSARQENVDDVAFFSALLAELAAIPQADPKRIFMVGVWNGGMMTHRIACDMPQAIAAAVAGWAPSIARTMDWCSP